MDPRSSYLGLSDLLERDLSAYEFYKSLSEEAKQKALENDVGSFEELQEIAKKSYGGIW